MFNQKYLKKMKKLKKLTLKDFSNEETVDQILSTQNLKEVKGGGFGIRIYF